MGTAIKVIMFLIRNWGTLKTLISEISKLFKGESSNQKVQECLDGVCKAADEKAKQQKRGGLLSRLRRRH